MRIRRIWSLLAAFALCAASLLFTTAATAEAKPDCRDKITVSHLSDVDGGKHQLREAINDVCDGGTIKIRPGTIILERGQLQIPEGKTVTIVGLPANGKTPKVTIDANQTSRVFNVLPGADLTVDSVIATGGSATIGGAIFTFTGTVTITNSIITGNTARSRAGGGGVANTYGTLTIANSIIAGNTATSAAVGGGVYNTYGTLTITNSAVSSNTARTGGGIYNLRGAVTITDSIINNNTAGSYGGGVFTYTGTVTLDGSTTITGNTSSSGGGVYWTSGSTVVVNPPATVAGNTPDDIYPPLPGDDLPPGDDF